MGDQPPPRHMSNGIHEQSRPGSSLDEALQRTPLTSINPFDTDIVPCPSVGPSFSSLPLLSQAEQQQTSRELRSLDDDASSSQQFSPFFRQTFNDLRHILNPDELTVYQLPSVPTSTHEDGIANRNPVLSNGNMSSSHPPDLGAFAATFLNSTKVSFEHRYPTPVSPPPASATRPPTTTRSTATPTRVPHPIKTEELIDGTMSNPSSQTPVVKIPPSQSSLADYQAFPEIDAQILEEQNARSRKRKRAVDDTEEKLREGTGDLSEHAANALHNLQDLLYRTFEAEDRLEPDTSGSRNRCDDEYFETTYNGQGNFILTAPALSRLDSATTKAINTKRFSEVPAEYLTRLQKLCHKVIIQSTESNLELPSSEDALAERATSLELVDSSLLASRAMLRIMSAGREEKELYSEEILADLLSMLKQVLERLVIPIVERNPTSGGSKLRLDSLMRSLVNNITQRLGRVFKMFGDLLLRVDISETDIVTVEDLSIKLVFVATGAEKDSIISLQKYETLRRHAMDVLARIFLKTPSQRASILDEVLSSVEKLPATRQSARHFRVADRKPIQLVSALILQLLQTAATKVPERRTLSTQKDLAAEIGDDSEDSIATKSKDPPRELSQDSLTSLRSAGEKLRKTVREHAVHVVNYLVNRALKSSKSSDEPYRNLLDIFTEDFVNVLGSYDWPAAELLLQVLLIRLLGIVENEKSIAPAKNMALDLIGLMGSGIADLKLNLDKMSRAADSDEAATNAQQLLQLSQTRLQGEILGQELLDMNGPFRSTIEYLASRSEDDLQLQNARNYLLLQWAAQVWHIAPVQKSSQRVDEVVINFLDARLRTGSTLTDASYSSKVDKSSVQMSYTIIVLHSAFGRAGPRIFSTLINSINSQHATVRSKALKSVISLLERDPSMLDNSSNMLRHILVACTDNSTMVRDSALGLIGRCIGIRPGVEEECVAAIITRASDPTIGIRKRAIGLLKGIYKRNKQSEVRSEIAIALLGCMRDSEDSVTDLTQQTLEELWVEPFASIAHNEHASLAAQKELQDHTVQLITIAGRSRAILKTFELLFHNLLAPSCKTVEQNRHVCKAIVGVLFDTFIENDQRSAKKSRVNILAFLALFAQAGHYIFNITQLKMLQAYTQNVKTRDDLQMLSPVATIYAATLPVLPATQRDFIMAIHVNLRNSLAFVPDSGLVDRMTQCLWALDRYLQNSVVLARLFCSSLQTILKTKESDTGRITKLITLTGCCAKNWSVEAHVKVFQDAFPWWKGDEVPDLVVNILVGYAKPECAIAVQHAALVSICQTCQSWPKHFLQSQVSDLLASVFHGGDKRLQLAAITGLRDFFAHEEHSAKQIPNEEASSKDHAPDFGPLSKSMVLSDHDSAATFLAQKFLNHMLRLALASLDDIAVTATELITSANRQGLVHPRESASVLVALETSPNEQIARMAFVEHSSLNSKHESILEKEYLNAIERSFQYQQDAVLDSSGITRERLPKLGSFFEVLKSSTVSTRKKILTNLCKRLDFDAAKTTVAQLEDHYMYAKYVCQNLALVEHSRVDEILAITGTLESIFGKTGNSLSQHIEAFHAKCSQSVEGDALLTLHQHALSATILTLLWYTRTCLRAITTNLPTTRNAKSMSQKKAAPKERQKDAVNKAPLKSTNASALLDAYLQNIELAAAFEHEGSMRRQIDEFMELHSTDLEAKVVGTSEDEMSREESPTHAGAASDRPETPNLEGNGHKGGSVSEGRQAVGGKRKRSSFGSAAGTPSKTGRPRGRPSLGKRKSSSTVKKWDDDAEGWG